MLDRISQISEWLKNSPSDAFLNHALALEFLKINQYDKALEHFVFNEKNNPDYIGTYYHLAKLYQQLNQSDAAKTCFEQGLTLAKKLNDQHAFSELRSALDELLEDE